MDLVNTHLQVVLTIDKLMIMIKSLGRRQMSFHDRFNVKLYNYSKNNLFSNFFDLGVFDDGQ